MNYNKKKNITKKRAISGLLVCAMLLSILVGSFAYFTDRAETQATATAGTLAINLDDSEINLLDDDGKDILNPGDRRNIKYTVTNAGNKSTDIRETLLLFIYDREGNPLNVDGDAATQSQFDVYAKDDVELVAGYGYQPKQVVDANGINPGDSGYVDTYAQPIQVKSIDGNKISYSTDVYVLNGNATKFNDTEREIETGITTDTHTNEYVLVFRGNSDNTFQGAILKMDLIIEARQHRNTENVGWVELQTEEYIASNGAPLDVVPKLDNETLLVIPEYDPTARLASIDWEYEVDDTTNTITLTKYIGSNPDVTVYNAYNVPIEDGSLTIAGEETPEYRTYKNVAMGTTMAIFSDNNEYLIKTIRFEEGVTLPEDISGLFINNKNATSIDVSNLDTSHVTNMRSIFYGCYKLTSIPGIKDLDTSNVTNFNAMFASCSDLVDLDVGGWNTSKVTSMDMLFNACDALKNLNVSGWDTSHVTTMGLSFNSCGSLETLDLSSWDLSHLPGSEFDNMFTSCTALTSVIVKDTATKTLMERGSYFPAGATVTVAT